MLALIATLGFTILAVAAAQLTLIAGIATASAVLIAVAATDALRVRTEGSR